METLPQWMVPTTSIDIDDDGAHSNVHQITERERRSRAAIALERVQFTNAFDYIIEQLIGGRLLPGIISAYPVPLDRGRFLNWVYADPQRKARYYEATEMGCELVVAENMDLEIDEQRIIPEEVELAQLRFAKVKWYAGNINKRRYGNVQQIELNQSISITAALAAANGRLIEHNANEGDE